MAWFDNLFKSKEDREKESKAYYAWAYPYGEEHKQKINELLHVYIPEEDEKFVIYNYLVTRQVLAPSLYEGPCTVDLSDFNKKYKKIKNQMISRGKKDIFKYIALVETDLKIDENLNYPSIEEIKARENELVDL